MALTALILLVLADDSKIVLSSLFVFALGLVAWSIKNSKSKANKDYVDEKFNAHDKKISEVKQYVKDELEDHKRNDDRLREQLNCTLLDMNQKLGLILDKLIPEQNQQHKKR